MGPPRGLHGRGLSESTLVSDYSGLVSALAGSTAEILLEAGTYDVTSTLSISRDVTLAVAVSGATVVPDGQGSTQVMSITSGTVQLTVRLSRRSTPGTC